MVACSRHPRPPAPPPPAAGTRHRLSAGAVVGIARARTTVFSTAKQPAACATSAASRRPHRLRHNQQRRSIPPPIGGAVVGSRSRRMAAERGEENRKNLYLPCSKRPEQPSPAIQKAVIDQVTCGRPFLRLPTSFFPPPRPKCTRITHPAYTIGSSAKAEMASLRGSPHVSRKPPRKPHSLAVLRGFVN